MFEELFRSKRLTESKLEPFGFRKEGERWRLEREIMNGEFILSVFIGQDGQADTELTEKETGEEYVLYRTNASGAFLGDIRLQIQDVLSEIVSDCYMPEVFMSRQAELLTGYAGQTYGDELEFLWAKLPETAIWRRKDNSKWYGILTKVARGKIDGSGNSGICEVVDLRMEKEEKNSLLSEKGFYPGWHMNKDSWFSVILDGTVSDDELLKRLDVSYMLAGGKNSYEKIYEVVKSIPEGKVATYGQVARLAGNPKWSRVVGYALHVNPEPGVIPCHRVVNSKGEPSRAFAFGGENRQIELLEKEGVGFFDGHVDMKSFLWEA